MVLGLILYEVSVVGGGVNGFLGSIFYWHTVVGGVVNCIVVIYGGGTHSVRRYSRDCEVIKLYRCIHAARNGDQFFYPSNRNLRFRCEMR